MNVRRLTAAAAVPCLCLLAFEANAQVRRADRPIATAPAPAFNLRELPPSRDDRAQRIGLTEDWAEAPNDGMLGAWDMGGNARFGLGRFRVGEIARPRSNTERVRDDLMARENRAIAGAGVRVSFD